MRDPTRDELVSIVALETNPHWDVFRKWLRGSLREAFEKGDAAIMAGRAGQLVELMDYIDAARTALRNLDDELERQKIEQREEDERRKREETRYR